MEQREQGGEKGERTELDVGAAVDADDARVRRGAVEPRVGSVHGGVQHDLVVTAVGAVGLVRHLRRVRTLSAQNPSAR